MRWRSKYTRADYAPNTTRLKRAFAWLPVYIDGQMVWLETYEILQAYEIKEIELLMDGEEKPLFFSIGKWIDVSKRIIE